MAVINYNKETKYRGVFAYLQRELRVKAFLLPEKSVLMLLILYYIVDIKDNLLVLKGYEYKAYYKDVFAEWFMSGSIDGTNYEVIHHQTNYSAGNDLYLYDFFDINTSLKAYRFFKFEPVGEKTIHERKNFAIHRLEFYGILYDMYNSRSTQRLNFKKRSNNMYIFMILVLST